MRLIADTILGIILSMNMPYHVVSAPVDPVRSQQNRVGVVPSICFSGPRWILYQISRTSTRLSRRSWHGENLEEANE